MKLPKWAIFTMGVYGEIPCLLSDKRKYLISFKDFRRTLYFQYSLPGMLDSIYHLNYNKDIQCPPKVLGQFVNFKKSLYSQNSSHPMKYNQFSAKKCCLVSDDMNLRSGLGFHRSYLYPYYLKTSFKINIFLENVGKYFHFVPELLESTVFCELTFLLDLGSNLLLLFSVHC